MNELIFKKTTCIVNNVIKADCFFISLLGFLSPRFARRKKSFQDAFKKIMFLILISLTAFDQIFLLKRFSQRNNAIKCNEKNYF